MIAEVAKNTVVTLDYTVTDADGQLVDEGLEPMVYLHGGYEDIFLKIEDALQGKRVGESIRVQLQPAEAFGEYDADLVLVESRDKFPEELQVGMQLEGGPEGTKEEEFMIFRVTDIEGDKVVLDGNHPLAGLSLIFNCSVAAIRNASPKELELGYVIGEDGEEG